MSTYIHRLELTEQQQLHDEIGRLLGWEQVTFEIKGESEIVRGAWRHPIHHPVDASDPASGCGRPQFNENDIIEYWEKRGVRVRTGAQRYGWGKGWYACIGNRKPVWSDSKFTALKLATHFATWREQP